MAKKGFRWGFKWVKVVSMMLYAPPQWARMVAAATVCLLILQATGRAELKPRRWYDPRRYADRGKQIADCVGRLEIVEMLGALAHGQPPDDGKGWFHGGQSRYGWQSLAERYDADGDGAIVPDEFPPEASSLLARLDRDENGKIEQADFDWSSNSPYVKQMSQTRRLFGSVDRDRNGQITLLEWREFFDRAALDADSITPADLQSVLFPPQPASSGDDPSPLDFLRGFVSGELGSISQGPKIGQLAPDFELADQKNEQRTRLSQFRDKKPVVLIFGSFT
jgi:hypothetical protein